MPKPVCVKCQRFYRPAKNGYRFVEGKPKGGVRAPSGTSHPELWEPYKLWNGDKWRCDGCGNEIVVGCGQNPIAHDYEPDFLRACESFGAEVQVNDC